VGDVIFLADKLSVILMTLSVTFIDNLIDMRVIDNRFELNSQAMLGKLIDKKYTRMLRRRRPVLDCVLVKIGGVYD
jgi:restriction endonuclease